MSMIPTEPEQITARWLTTALQEAGVEGVVREVALEPVGTGQMARSYRVVLGGEGSIPASLVCKLPSAEDAVRQLGASGYRREVDFYERLAPHLTMRVPRCWHTRISDDDRDFVLVLEDLAPSTQGDQIAGCRIDQAEAAARQLARLHGPTWTGQAATDTSWLRGDNIDQLALILPIAHDQFVEDLGDRLDRDHLAVLEAFTRHATGWVTDAPPRVAAVHGDFRLDNLLFGGSGDSTDVAVVDWQTVSLRPVGCDLAYFLGNSLPADDRRSAEDAIVSAYVEELGLDDYDVDTCRDDLRYGAFQGPLITMLGAFAATRTDRGDDMFVAMASRSCAQILDYDSLALLHT